VTVSFRGTAALVAAMTISLVLTGSAGAFPGETSVASVNSAGTWVPGGSGELPFITADGRYVVFSTPVAGGRFVAFESLASTLVPGFGGHHAHVHESRRRARARARR
jgi:hypothetical protein